MIAQLTYGSVCSGIECGNVALHPLGFIPLWLSEIESFQCKILKNNYPTIPNVGDMNSIRNKLITGKIPTPNILMGGTPCNSFSLLGERRGLNDDRGRLTLEFINISDTIDELNDDKCLLLFENVEGILNDKCNAFGFFLSKLVGNRHLINNIQWGKCGIAIGNKRIAVWRLIDSLYFNHAQSRKRLFLLASGNEDYNVINMLLEVGSNPINIPFIDRFDSYIKYVEGKKVEVFKPYTNCLTASYGNRYNDSTSFKGSFFISMNDRIRRLTPIECERLMGLPDNYTLINGIGDLKRYNAIGNGWAVNVIKWIGERIKKNDKSINLLDKLKLTNGLVMFKDSFQLEDNLYINASVCPYNYTVGNILDIIQLGVDEKYYLKDKTIKGILNRGKNLNPRLRELYFNSLSISDKIKMKRKEFGLSQLDLSNKVGISKPTLIKIEKGDLNVSYPSIEKMLQVLDIK